LPNSDRIPRRYAFAFLTACALLGALLFAPGGELLAQDKPRVSKVCLDCHAGQDTTLAATGHRLPGGGLDGPAARIACTDCHAGDRRHWEEDPGAHAMTNPAKVGAAAEARLCATCHQNAHQQNAIEKNVHAANDVNCSACHSVHGSKHPALLQRAESGLCLGCHKDVEGQFARSYRHPVNDGIVKCSECHLTLDTTRRPLASNGTNVCMKCHGEFEGPFPFEHPAAVDYSTEEGGCVTCHEPHGSHLPRMLKQPYEAPHFQLCTQCHSVPRHNSNPMHGTRWAGVPCNDCHTDIHGSYTSRLFLSETLEGQGCFNVGCHKF
jgi:DmsE family decaheme c-type cytochrome